MRGWLSLALAALLLTYLVPVMDAAGSVTALSSGQAAGAWSGRTPVIGPVRSLGPAVQATGEDRDQVMRWTATVAGIVLLVSLVGYLYRRVTGKVRIPTEEEYLAAQHAIHGEHDEEGHDAAGATAGAAHGAHH